MKLKTEYINPSIPDRTNDWCAYDDNTYGGGPGQPLGRGRFEAEAVADLVRQLGLITQVIMTRRADRNFEATIVTREGVELFRQAIYTWQDEMRWDNIAREMRDEWNQSK